MASLKYVLNYALNTCKKKQKIEMDFVKQVVLLRNGQTQIGNCLFLNYQIVIHISLLYKMVTLDHEDCQHTVINFIALFNKK